MPDQVSLPESALQRLQTLELAYQSAIALGQFKSEFLARTSHELRSPLNSLISGLQLILSDLCDSPEEEREYLQIAHTSALKLVNLLDQVIQVSKLQHRSASVQVQSLDLAAVLQNVEALTQMLAQNRNLRLYLPQLPEALLVRADPTCLQQGLLLLIDSAIAQMQRGEIILSLHQDEDQVHLVLRDDRPAHVQDELREQMQTTAASLGDRSENRAPAVGLLQNNTPTVDVSSDGRVWQRQALKADLARDLDFSPAFKLMLARELLMASGGRLDWIGEPDRPEISCTLPLA
jgi:K+-sensing histidine kinase KdpD